MPALVYPLEETPDDPALVGGKAAGLGRLVCAGLPVPPGFVLGADAFRAFLRANDLENKLAARANAEAEVRAWLRIAQWPEELRSAVEGAYEALRRQTGYAPVAVRSSATAEDSAGASFAGQHATLLNLDGLDAVLDAVLICWASLYDTAAAQYRRALEVDDDGPAMAVVVQALVPAEASGVAFTLDPVSGDRELVLIDAAWGLGEGVVGGLVTPDHFAVRKADGAIVRREVAAKRARVTPAPGGGTRSEELSGALAQQPALDDGQAVELARLAVRIEELMGAPQDIEWALADGRFFVLQSRPVTAAGAAQPASREEGRVSEFDTETDPETIWTSANIQEVLPGQLSPLNISMTQSIVERFGTELVRRMGIKLKTKDPFSALFYGRAFLNVSMMLEMADWTPFGSVEAIMEQFFGEGRAQFTPIVPKGRFSWRRLYRYVAVTPRVVWFSLRMPADVRRAEKIVARLEREVAERPFEQQSGEELIRAAEEGLESGGEVGVIHVSGGGLTSTNFEMLRNCTEAWLDDENGMLQARLCTGLAAVESAQPAYELWDLSRLVLASPQLCAAFETAPGAEIERRLAALRGDDVAAFRRRLAEFLSRHGHRSVMESEAAAKSWEEDLPTVFTMLGNYLHAEEAAAPRRIEERQRQEREEATRDALRRLRWWQRPIFRYMLGQAQKWVRMREHTKSLLLRTTHRGRRLTRELGRRLVARGLLDDVFDLYELTWDEAKALVRGQMNREDAYAQIERRKAEAERNQRVVLPETFRGRPSPLRPEDFPLPEGHVLRGIPVSPGRVTGPARVILDPRRDAAIEPGEILVAPVTDAGWTPLFVVAAGIVVDTGGTLSHGSTVAREYGLPAVVNVRHGTRLIRTGQIITVDGAQGVVVLEGAD
ncbi:MAG: hypothetical protein A2148_05115 [Chloroflexi bacterium RBG_16_68_14]|nr:MAG: hypothetical protein A2148_05115 [Chloroflexi bacterium RBG_16_68_14]